MLKVKRYKQLVLSLTAVAAFYLWVVFAATHPTLPSSDHPLLFYSNQQRQDLKQVFAHALQRAEKSLWLQMYAITDPGLLTLLKRSQKKGIATRIYYDASASPNLQKNLSAIPFKGRGLMHRKLLVIDKSLIFLGSANMTQHSLDFHDNLILGLYHPEFAAFLEKEEGTAFSFQIEEQKGDFWLLPEKESDALKRLLSEIDSAQNKIRIAIFTITHPEIANALLAAHKRGVKIKIAVDLFTERGASHRFIETLENAGIPIYCSQGQQLLHHKWALIDDTTLIIGSANWTKAAFTLNQDCILFLSPLSKSQKKIIKSLWKSIRLESELKINF